MASLFLRFPGISFLVVSAIAVAAPAAQAAEPLPVDQSWAGYMPEQALQEAFSEPLKFAGRAKGLNYTIASCIWRNSKATVVREYCGENSANATEATGFYVISHEGKGIVHLFAEEGKDVTVYAPSAGKKGLSSKATPHQVVSFVSSSIDGDGLRSCTASVSSSRKVTPATCVQQFETKASRPFTTPWSEQLTSFWGQHQGDFDRLSRAVVADASTQPEAPEPQIAKPEITRPEPARREPAAPKKETVAIKPPAPKKETVAIKPPAPKLPELPPVIPASPQQPDPKPQTCEQGRAGLPKAWLTDKKLSRKVQEYLAVQGKLSLHRMAWAYLKLRKDKTETVEQMIRRLLKSRDPKLHAQFLKQNTFKAGKRNQALVRAATDLKSVLEQRFGSDKRNASYILDEADIHSLEVLAGLEKDFGTKQRTGVMDFVSLINNGYKRAKDSGTGLLKAERMIKLLERKADQLRHEIEEGSYVAGCTSEKQTSVCADCAVRELDSAAVIGASSGLAELLAEPRAEKQGLRDSFRWGRYWLHVK